MRIFLVGFMGAGKSYLGIALAKQLGFEFIDLDQVIEGQAGMSIPSIFDQLGEPAFRQMEAGCLRQMAAMSNIVVATGGGVPCYLENMEWMNEHGITIYLHAPAKLLKTRLLPEKSLRPLLANIPDEDLEGYICAKIAERTQFYEQSHIQFEVPDKDLDGLSGLSNYLRRFFSKIN